MRMNSDPQKKEKDTSNAGANTGAYGDGPLSKENFDRFNQAVRETQAKLGARNIAKIRNDMAFTDAIKEDTINEAAEGEEGEDYVPGLKEEQNPLISLEYRKIIEAAIPKYTMQNLLGLSNTMYLILKNTEFWMISRGHKKSTKQGHFEFAKQLFKIWDADGGGSLDVDEISLPLIALGLSTDTSFVEKLIKTLVQKKGVNQKDEDLDLSFTLKDFVTIFQADRIGEKITRTIQKEFFLR